MMIPMRAYALDIAARAAGEKITEEHIDAAGIALQLHRKRDGGFHRIDAVRKLMKDGHSLPMAVAAVRRAVARQKSA